jgi:hypothetical protein
MRLVVQIIFSTFCAADVLVAVGMFDVTMVTGSASVGVTTAYSPSPLKPVVSCQMSLTPSSYSSEISMGFRKSTKNQIWAR